MNVNVLEARNQLSALLRIVEDNPDEIITISRRGVAVADLVSHRAAEEKAIHIGIADGQRIVPSEDEMRQMDAELVDLMEA